MEEGTKRKASSDNQYKFGKLLNWFILGLFILTICVFATVHVRGLETSQLNYIFSLLLGIIPFLASFQGFWAAKHWGGLKSSLGKSVMALSLGLLFWSLGELIWSYYNLVADVAAPYPSVADVGFTLGVTFWIISALLLSKVTAVWLFLKRLPWLWILVTLFVLLATGLSYYLMVEVARQGVLLTDTANRLKIFFDLYYPFADLISLMIVGVIALVSGRYLGGKLLPPLLYALCGWLVMYFGDVIFSYTTTTGSFYNSNWGDLVLLAGISLLSLSLIKFARLAPEIGRRSTSSKTGS